MDRRVPGDPVAVRGQHPGSLCIVEVGILDPEPVDRSVWDVLADVLKANVRGLAVFRPEPPGLVASAFMREPTGTQARLAHAPEAPKAEERDEIDALFLGP